MNELNKEVDKRKNTQGVHHQTHALGWMEEFNMITAETRRDSYKEIVPKTADRKSLILWLLEIKDMTAHELTEQLLMMRLIPYYDRNFVSPRLTELKQAGAVEAVAKRYCKRTDRQVAVWRLNNDTN